MIDVIEVKDPLSLGDYASYSHLRHAVSDLHSRTKEGVQALEGRTVWMLNSTAQGGGVAEMMPKLVSLLRELGVTTEWAVIAHDHEKFFQLTKRLHNLIHGAGDPHLTSEDRALYESVSREIADALMKRLGPDDILVAHDPQPLAVGAMIKEAMNLPTVWRCHIGLDRQTSTTQAGWSFLEPWARRYDRTVFTLPAYVPGFLSDHAQIIHPGIDPLSHKNRELSTHKFTGILNNSGLAVSMHPSLTPDFDVPARRLQQDGSFSPATHPEDLGLLFRPIITQVSRWDRLKGFLPLLQGFVRLKDKFYSHRRDFEARHGLRLELVRLLLAGPDPASIQDDPEGIEVFREICDTWRDLHPRLQRDVAILCLPMKSRKDNALMVNALQRCSTIVAQNSLREGFGLTATEAMWKQCPVLGTHAAGLEAQIRDNVHGRLLEDPQDADEIAETLDEMLESKKREMWGRNAQRRVADKYLVLTQVRRWVEVLTEGRRRPLD